MTPLRILSKDRWLTSSGHAGAFHAVPQRSKLGKQPMSYLILQLRLPAFGRFFRYTFAAAALDAACSPFGRAGFQLVRRNCRQNARSTRQPGWLCYLELRAAGCARERNYIADV